MSDLIRHIYAAPILEEVDILKQRGEFVFGNIYVRPNYLQKRGVQVGGHTHNFDHTTEVKKGSILIRAVAPDGKETQRIVKQYQAVLIKAEVKHFITALEDETIFWCMYSHRNAQGEVVQEFKSIGDIHEGAYH